MDVYGFIKEYFIDSIVYKEGYNPVNTMTFAAILIVAIYLLYRYLSPRVRFDLRFALYTFPYILLGSSTRIVEDAGFVQPPYSYLLMTPFIYILTFIITFAALIISLRTDYRRYPYPGIVLSLIVLAFLFTHLEVENWWVIPTALTIAATITAAYHLISTKIEADSFSKAVVFAQLMDGSTSFLGIQFLGYWELHVVPRYFISLFGPWIMVPLKLAVIIPILYILDREEEEESLAGFIKFVLFTLGFAPGIRNGLRMTFGV
ncbi:putative membrane protein [Geoglobus ahangari]|uniref:Putative membrane protein n=1 Tax=Geoglobus ahangari TaxID=113653 RepID=A0A0F7IDT6_9EURY|nr:DUF63 family protein [Geoglobus ahangari]AKG90792.1 putative membrane protein [Geoglobus ahangari]